MTEEEGCKIQLKFFSPKVRHNVTLVVELSKGSAGGSWRIRRLTSLPEFFTQLGENYEDEMHALVASSLSGISDAAVSREVTHRITESQTAQDLLKKFNIKLK